jgi:transposase
MEVTMKNRKVYTTEFKQEAVRLIEQPEANVQQIAKDLGVFEVQNPYNLLIVGCLWDFVPQSDHSLYTSRKAAQSQGGLAFPGNGKIALTADPEENLRLKKELELVKQERDILKKAVGCLDHKAAPSGLVASLPGSPNGVRFYQGKSLPMGN